MHHEVSVDEVGHVDLDDIRPLDREGLGHEALEQVVEPRAVVVVDEAVAVDAQVLVRPEADDVLGSEQRRAVAREHALN